MLRRLVSMLWVAVLGVTTASAQQAGQIIGVVTDSSGAVVEAVEVGRTFAWSAITGSAGEYVLPALRPTQHELVAEMRGFRSFPRSGVELLANQSLTLNVVLEVGAVTETVEVAGAAVQVNTTTSTLSEVVDWARIIELPLNGRDAARLAVLVPDTSIISVSAENGKSIPGGLQPSSNGTRNQQVAHKLDGTTNTDTYFQENRPFPFPDALQEFLANSLSTYAPTIDEQKGDFSTCGAPCNQILRDPLGGVFPNNQIPVRRFDPAAIKVNSWIPAVGGDVFTVVARPIHWQQDQGVAKIDHPLTDNDRLSGRYFIDYFQNASTYDPSNLLSDRNPTLASRVRSQSGVRTWIRGDVARQRIHIVNEFRRGHFRFSGDGTGLAMADYFLGAIRTFDQGTGEYKDFRVIYPALFLQDDWKVSKRLTLNVGVRYEPAPPYDETHGHIEVFRPEDFSANIKSRRFLNAPVRETFRGYAGVPDNGTLGDYNNWAGRLGFGWPSSERV